MIPLSPAIIAERKLRKNEQAREKRKSDRANGIPPKKDKRTGSRDPTKRKKQDRTGRNQQNRTRKKQGRVGRIQQSYQQRVQSYNDRCRRKELLIAEGIMIAKKEEQVLADAKSDIAAEESNNENTSTEAFEPANNTAKNNAVEVNGTDLDPNKVDTRNNFAMEDTECYSGIDDSDYSATVGDEIMPTATDDSDFTTVPIDDNDDDDEYDAIFNTDKLGLEINKKKVEEEKVSAASSRY